MKRFFSYDMNDGVMEHDTAEEARERVLNLLELYRQDAAEGWPEETEYLYWGEIKEVVDVISREPDPSGRFDELLDFGLVKVWRESETRL